MTKKIIFFDVDGTLVDVRPSQEYIPASTVKAVQATRDKGNLCFLCTGRSKAEIFDHIMDVGFDGIIGAGGLYASKNLIPRLERIMYGDLENDPVARRTKAETPNHFIGSLKEGYDLHRDDVNKICFLEKDNFPFEKIKKEFEQEFNVIHCTVPIFGDNSGELSVPGVNKASAINALIDELGIPKENTYAFGDGLNDADMLEFCQYGIAVGNAKEALKEIADEVTDDIKDDGIYNSMKKYGLID